MRALQDLLPRYDAGPGALPERPQRGIFFIDTEETAPDYQAQEREFLTAKGFPFRVLFDAKTPNGKTLDATYSKYSKEYRMSGIPQKLIIDPSGNLCFIAIGYGGSPSALADEMQAMIELARAVNRVHLRD